MAKDRRKQGRRHSQFDVSSERRSSADRRTLRERRRDPRVPLELWMEEMSGDDVYFRRTGDVSEGGVFFEGAIPHKQGTEVTLKFALPGDREMVVARGKVLNSASDPQGPGYASKVYSRRGRWEKTYS